MNQKAQGMWIIGIIIIIVVAGAAFYWYSTQNKTPSPVVTNSNPNPSTEPVVTSTGETHDIKILDFAFIPKTLPIKKGDTVKWTNDDTATHTIISDSRTEIDSGNIAQDQSYSHTFNTVGTFAYHCSIHPAMKGTITVTE